VKKVGKPGTPPGGGSGGGGGLGSVYFWARYISNFEIFHGYIIISRALF